MPEALPPILLGEEVIRARVEELAREISADYSEVDEILLVGVLRGCYMFLADLSRRMTVPRRVDFIALSTYPGPATTPGSVRLLMDLRTDVAGRHVLVVEDIVDTGRTLSHIRKLLAARHPASLRVCALVRKPTRLRVEAPVEYLGFDIPDRWVVGYGLDYAGRFRALPYIGLAEMAPAPADERKTPSN